MMQLLEDFRHSARHLRKSPAFTLTAILTLALGIGVNAAIFSLMDALVLRPLRVPDLDRIVNINEAPTHGSDRQPVALANYRDWKQQASSFAAMAIYRTALMNLTGAGDPAHVMVSQAEPSFFDVFQARPLFGRTFRAAEATPGRDAVTVLGYGLWRQRFAGDLRVLGKTIELDHRKYTIVGVLPQGFRYPPIARLWVPLPFDAARLNNRSQRDASVVGRLRPSVTLGQAQADLRLIASRLAHLHPATNSGWSVHMAPLLNTINGDLTADYIRMVFGASGFLLLVICANLTNLQFARALSRRSEIAIRSAIGAGRWPLFRQLLTENLLLAALGTTGGLLFAQLYLDRVVASMPSAVAVYLAGWDTLHLNGRALACACIVAVGCAVLSGLAPAIGLFRVDLVDALKSGGRSVSASKGTDRLRNVFVVAQITFALTLVVGSALMVKGMRAMSTAAEAYKPDQQLVAEVVLPNQQYPSRESLQQWFAASTAKLRALPGVDGVAITTDLPYSNGGPWVENFAMDDKPVEPGVFQSSQRLTTSPNYLSSFHIPLVAGRLFNYDDGLSTQPVALVSRAFVRRYLPKQNPIGHKVRFTGPGETVPALTIVGVTEDVIYSWTDKYPEPAIYVNAFQFPSEAVTYIVHSRGTMAELPQQFRKALASLDRTLPIDRLETYAAYLNESLIGLKYVVVMLLEDAVIALLLSSIGIFGIIAISVAERTREIGIRLAVGAQGREVVSLLLRRAVLLTVAGLVLGMPIAIGLTRLLASLFYGVESNDPGTLLLTAGLIAAVTVGASYMAARRAASVDPMRALQSQ